MGRSAGTDPVSRRGLLAVGIVAGSGVVAAAAKAKGVAVASQRRSTFSITGNAARVAQTTDDQGTKSTYAAQTRGTLGRGAMTFVIPDPRNGLCAPNDSVRAYFGGGSLVGEFRGAIELLPDGRIGFRGPGIVRSGGGDLRGARGRFSIIGTSSADGSTASFAVTGSFTR